MAANLPTYFIDSGLRTPREAEVPNADWDGGVNAGASCAPRIGVATGFPNFKEQDWPRSTNADILVVSQVISGAQSGLFVIDPDFGPTALTGLLQATGSVQVDGTVGNVAGFPMRNKTGEELSAGDWVFGTALN